MCRLKIRIISAVIGIPILIAIISYGGLPLQIALAIFSLVGVFEFYRAVNKDIKKINVIGYVFTIIFSFVLLKFNLYSYFIFTSLFILALLTSMITHHDKYNIKDVAITFIGFYYVCFLLSHVLLVREQIQGSVYVWLIFITAWGSDTGAYFTGKAIGKRKLAPKLSPNKTIEGSIGGIILSAVLCIVYGLCMETLFSIKIDNVMFRFAIIGVIGSIVGQLGDLTASAIKRYTGIKDYGNLIPGHGGVLDRFDSILFTAPLVYCLIILMGI